MKDSRSSRYVTPSRRGRNLDAKVTLGILALWVVGFLVNIGIIAVIIWAIIALVRHVTG